MLLKKTIISLLDKIGYTIIPNWQLDSFFLTKRIKKIINTYQIDCIIDVGANTGQYYEFLRKQVQYNGLIVSFEPDPENIRFLEKKNKDKNWIIQGYALGQESTILNFNIMKQNSFNSFLQPDHSETEQFKQQNIIKKTIQVPVKRLDDILQTLQKKFVFNKIFLKIDTQGFDLQVFKGAYGLYNQIKAVQTEVSVMPIYKNAPGIEDSLKLFRKSGYEVSALYPIFESKFPHAVEFDCIYLPAERTSIKKS